MKKPLESFPVMLFMALVVANGHASAQISTDATLGRAPRGLQGPEYAIDSDLGRIRGQNLFHSFERFSLARGESATFSGPAAIRNVISRVTGGERSEIHGRIASSIDGADFYFINPAGVLFGPHASLEVPGSFYVSTSDELRFADGEVFSAQGWDASGLSVAAPETFGFLGRSAGPITLDRVQRLPVEPGRSLSLVGGDILIDEGLIEPRDFDTQNANVTLVAMSRPGTVAVADGRPSAAAQGGISVTGSLIDISSAAGGGVVRIRAGNLVLENSDIFADSEADAPGPGTALIEIEAGSVRVDFARVASVAMGAGDAGDVMVQASELAILNFAELSSDTVGRGDAGDVIVNTGELEIAADGQITSRTDAAGNAGKVLVTADHVTIHSGRPDRPTGITTSTLGAGVAGEVMVEAEEITIRDSGFIFSNTFDRGNAGRVELSADRISVLTGGQVGSGTGESLNAGLQSTGAGGDVVVNARDAILISGQSGIRDPRTNEFPPSGIFASTESTSADGGEGGTATVTAPVITIADRGEIASETLNPAAGGTVLVSAERLVIDDGEITTKAESTGNGGRTEVQAGVLELRNGGLITARSTGGGRAGTVVVDAGAIELRSGAAISSSSGRNGAAGEVEVSADDRLLLLEGSQVTTTSARAGGGSIGLRVGDTIVLRDGNVTTSVQGGAEPTAGNIFIDPKVLVIDGGRIEADAGTGRGGNVELIADNILVPEGDLQGLIARGDISASGATEEVDGTVVVDAPDVDLSGGLVVLEGALLDAASQLRERCGARRDVGASSFTGVGRGGLPPSPDGPLAGAWLASDSADAAQDTAAGSGAPEEVAPASPGRARGRAEGWAFAAAPCMAWPGGATASP